jgi:phosphate transport system protein
MRTLSKTFDTRRAALTGHLAETCGQAGDAMNQATRALLNADLTLAEDVISRRDHFVAMTADAERQAVRLLAVPRLLPDDVRAVIGSLQNAADADRMWVLALHVATLTRRRHPQHAVPREVDGCFAEMGRLAVELGIGARDVLMLEDPRRAAQLRQQDDALDELHAHLFTRLLDPAWEHGVAAAVSITLLSRYYERFADHAVAIGRRIVYAVSGTSR